MYIFYEIPFAIKRSIVWNFVTLIIIVMDGYLEDVPTVSRVDDKNKKANLRRMFFL